MKRRRAMPSRIGLVHVALALLAIAILIKSAQVQLVQGRIWASRARRQHYTATEVPAPRGAILDASGRTLVTSREMVRIEVAPKEIRDASALRRALLAVRVDRSWAERATDATRAWVTLPGTYVAEDVAHITAMRGVYPTPVSDRTYPSSPGLRALLGRVDATGNGLDGLELMLDSLLRGEHAASQLARDVTGRSVLSSAVPGQVPRAGQSVALTINHSLQDITERALADAVARLSAEGGDIVIIDPRSGAVLAMAANRRGAPALAATAVAEPFEPGSTLKPLIASALLAQGRALVTDRVPMRGGSYVLHGRTIHDEPHPGAGPMPASLTLADVIRFSSNIGIVQFADRLTPREEFEVLRDFGLGAQTGLPYPAEAAGTLRPPATWSRQTPASLSMGYEVSVTPLQLALAYGAIANGGELLEPLLVREIRTADGRTRFRGARRVVRRVIPEDVARTMRGLLSTVVERGTAVDADMATYALAGKTGTPRRIVDGHYASMQYNPNFVGLFPADAPQLVIVVRLANPRGNFFGGSTAAPVTKAILQAALAGRDAALDRSQLTSTVRVGPEGSAGRAQRVSVATAERSDARENFPDTIPPSAAATVVLDVPTRGETPEPPQKPRRVPNVAGMRLRDAVRSLHLAGFRVQLERASTEQSPVTGITVPTTGTMLPFGSLVRLHYIPPS